MLPNSAEAQTWTHDLWSTSRQMFSQRKGIVLPTRHDVRTKWWKTSWVCAFIEMPTSNRKQLRVCSTNQRHGVNWEVKAWPCESWWNGSNENWLRRMGIVKCKLTCSELQVPFDWYHLDQIMFARFCKCILFYFGRWWWWLWWCFSVLLASFNANN